MGKERLYLYRSQLLESVTNRETTIGTVPSRTFIITESRPRCMLYIPTARMHDVRELRSLIKSSEHATAIIAVLQRKRAVNVPGIRPLMVQNRFLHNLLQENDMERWAEVLSNIHKRNQKLSSVPDHRLLGEIKYSGIYQPVLDRFLLVFAEYWEIPVLEARERLEREIGYSFELGREAYETRKRRL